MKRFITLFAILGAATANAVVSVNWTTPNNSIKGPDGTTNAPSTWIAQLIYSPDNAASALNPADPFVPTGGEHVMASRQLNVNNIAGRIFSATPKVSDADEFAGGFVYTRVFNVDYNGGSPTTPTFYGNSSVVSGPLQIETSTPSTIIAHWTAPTGTQLVVNQQIVAIPEPSTYALAAVGIAAALWRRRRKA